MTDFEQQVAEALEQRLAMQPDVSSASRQVLAAWLAPRVAAAIEAAGLADEREEANGPLGYRTQALAALWGEKA